jgi:uncharacterized protein YbjT (DUF2867 family)
MLTGEGLRDAVLGVDIVVHTAVDHNGAKTDVEMTRSLLEAAHAAGVSYFLYISIVAVDKLAAGPAKAKLACEALVLDGEIPSATLRFTQFFEAIDTMLHVATRLPVGVLPRGWKIQPIDVREVADAVVRAVVEQPLGLLPDFAGPQVLTFEEMVRAWKQARGSRKPILHIPIPGKLSAAFRSGQLTAAPGARVGKITWAQWLYRRYGHEPQNDGEMGSIYSVGG